jgi:hypothetical protein
MEIEIVQKNQEKLEWLEEDSVRSIPCCHFQSKAVLRKELLYLNKSRFLANKTGSE